MLKNKKSIIFDLDGTLADSIWVWKNLDEIYLEGKGIYSSDNLQEEMNGLSFSDAVAYIKNKFDIPDSLETMHDEWVALCKDVFIDDVSLKEGALLFVQKMHSMGYMMGVGTSNNKTIAQGFLQSKNLTRYFKTIRTSCEVGRGKPNPDVFLKVAEDLKVLPSECLVFEDTLEGVMAAKNAGMSVAAIHDPAHLRFEDEIKSLADHYFLNFLDAAEAV
ncbi:HAD family hydrolase [Alkalibacter mobilis]|uniref:HAD family hydrolase n=1 Tax=Alkalibacter mobilis TaxID=2787712 RepID=UPI00189F5C04|nr:HAD family phosphatase [Alkalibacter mobilis]MBF7096727.1 HAD family phosphatase [Alkalibacter mobilis]